MYFRILLVLLVSMAACKKDPSVWKIQNLNGNKILAFGHGGMGESYRYPMDSFESLAHCLDLGADGTEMDVCVTKDGVLVLSHSQSLEEQTSCSGNIKDKTWKEIEDCSFNAVLVPKTKLIPASYFFDQVQDRGRFIFTFDCKVTFEDNSEYLDLFATALVKHIEKYNLVSNSFIESFNGDFLRLLHAKNDKLHLFLYSSNYHTGFELSQNLDLYGLTLDTRNINASDISHAHEQGLRITLFNTSTERDNIEAIEKNPDFIQTDKVDFLINALK
jgi:glycerophosphoryl diester phosphodiesterase